MNSYVATVHAGVTVLLIIILGYICTKFKFVPVKDFDTLNLYTSKLCFFFMTFRSLAGKDKDEIDFRPLVISILMVLTIYILYSVIFFFPIKDKLGVYLSITFPAIYVNYFISGLPIFLALWDESQTAIISVTLVANDLVGSPIFLTLAKIRELLNERKKSDEQKSINEDQNTGTHEINEDTASKSIADNCETFQSDKKTSQSMNNQDKKHNNFMKVLILEILNKLVHNMFLVGIIFGLIYMAITSKMCTFVSEFINLLGDCVLPFALFNVGAFLSQQSLIACSWTLLLASLFGRLVLGPLIAGVYCYALGYSGKLSRQMVILCLLPTGAICFPMAQIANVGQGVASTMILWSAVFMIPFAVFWMWLLDVTNLFVE